ncbi:MAG: NAD(P)/FAD-dependent oxidoreductase [Desulfuromonadales bacterium]|nr:NAD(P)/FAD-dependent oxidoreductase [Desulfuromonadales bacterium]
MSLIRSDVIIVGAGPAGCAAALHLSGQGHAVILIERLALPQVKACGDALLPDALRALDRFGVADALAAVGKSLDTLHITAPNGAEVELAVRSLSLKRPDLHALLHERLRACGVELWRGEVLEPIRSSDGQICGVRCRRDGGMTEIFAPLVILASGARPETMQRFGMVEGEAPTAVAIRAYYRDYDNPNDTTLRIACHPAIAPGFFWLCPLPESQYSIGCGHSLAANRRPEHQYLQNRLEYLSRFYPASAKIVGQEDMIGTPCSSVLRTGLAGAKLYADGLLVTGEAAGSSSPLFGAGVGKALESGELAGIVAAEALANKRFDAIFLARYQERLNEKFCEVYAGQSKAQQWLHSAKHLNLLIRKAGRQDKLRQKLESVLNEDLPLSKAVSFWTFFLP